ncbi:unnamed protein product [Cuscuta campestris]|uniref:Retrotransposon gag domain-containing protein n=1 Tax=Cuscuta campestris TaxID=132261 RepID=A0A484LM62_9ASTE|nr:unnamed protein product [Cuscuta campestris]
MPLQAPMEVTSFQTPVPQPSPFQTQLVNTMAPVNLAGALNAAGPSRPPQGEVREAEPARTRRYRSNRQEPARTRASRQEEEAESQPRLPVANRLTIPNDRVQQMEAKLERLEKKVGEKNDRDKPLAGSPFTTRVHLTPFPRKVKIDAPRFTGKEDPEIHLDSFNQSATMNGCTDEEKCLLFFQTLRNRATEWFNKLRPGSIDSFSDLASKFKAKFQENCTKRKKFTYLSTAGQRESENLTQFLTRWKEEKRLGEAGNKWLEELPHIVWAFRVTPRRAHGETPFSLTYGCEARLPIEAEFPTFRESNYQPQQNEEDHLAELNLVEERRMAAEVKMSTYQQVVKKYHDNKVGPQYFQVGDEVLRRREASRPGDGGKLAKNWEGPYRVRAIIQPGTYRLETLDGVPIERT